MMKQGWADTLIWGPLGLTPEDPGPEVWAPLPSGLAERMTGFPNLGRTRKALSTTQLIFTLHVLMGQILMLSGISLSWIVSRSPELPRWRPWLY